MIRKYYFEYYENKKYQPKIVRKTTIELSNPIGKTEIDAKKAVEIFSKSCGNLKKNTIIKIKELGENGQIGEDIIPQEENAVVPVKRQEENAAIPVKRKEK